MSFVIFDNFFYFITIFCFSYILKLFDDPMSLKPHFYTIAGSHVMDDLKSSRNFGGPIGSSGDCHESSELKVKTRCQQLRSNLLIKSKTMVKGETK